MKKQECIQELLNNPIKENIDNYLFKEDDDEEIKDSYTLNYKEENYCCPEDLGLKELNVCRVDGYFKCKECWINAIKSIKETT